VKILKRMACRWGGLSRAWKNQVRGRKKKGEGEWAVQKDWLWERERNLLFIMLTAKRKGRINLAKKWGGKTDRGRERIVSKEGLRGGGFRTKREKIAIVKG